MSFESISPEARALSWYADPMALFYAGRWAACLHATIQAYNEAGDPEATQRAMRDDGLIHELAHLAIGIPIYTNHPNGLETLRVELARITEVIHAEHA